MGILYDRSYGYALESDSFLEKGKRYDIKYNSYSKKCEITGDDGVKHIYPSEFFKFDNYIESRSKKWKSITRGEDGIRRDGYGNILRDNVSCPWCGKKFDQMNKNQKYCCEGCALKFQRANYKKKEDLSKTKNNCSLEEYVRMCRERGMTYGQIISEEIVIVMNGEDDGKHN